MAFGIMVCINCGFVGAIHYINGNGPYCGKCADQHSPTHYYPAPPLNPTMDPIVINRACPPGCPGLRPEYDKAVGELVEAARCVANDEGDPDNDVSFLKRGVFEAIEAVEKARGERP